MSADNMILVIKRGEEYRVTDASCSMSAYADDAGYVAYEWERATPVGDRGEALILAHDRSRQASVLEYGVIECEVALPYPHTGDRSE